VSCTACGHDNPDRAKFCLECGAALGPRCASCGTELPPAARFCLACGVPVAGAARAAQPDRPASERPPHAYTPKHLAEKILTTRSALEGERKQVTVWFADVKGSMGLSEPLDPEDWHAILDRFFAVLTDAVHRFEGTVNQYTGDGVMALFGAPIAHEDHAHRACYAALHVKSELRALQDELRLSRGLDLQVRIGIHSGEVVVGKIGDDLRMDYTAQGHTVGLAQRMESIAAPNTAVLSDATAKRVEGFFALRSLGSSSVKGVREPVQVFELEGPGAARTRLDVSRARGFAKFVGRSDELGDLEAALTRAEAGHGQVLGVVAEAGAGKSRLCQEFAERCRARGVTVRTAHGVAHGRAVPLFPILSFYRQALGLEERDEPALARQKVAGALAQLDPQLLEALPLLCEFLGVLDPQGRPAGVAGPERERRLLGLLKRIMQARSASGARSGTTLAGAMPIAASARSTLATRSFIGRSAGQPKPCSSSSTTGAKGVCWR
jgi:class 3 adenylate cyclase